MKNNFEGKLYRILFVKKIPSWLQIGGMYEQINKYDSWAYKKNTYNVSKKSDEEICIELQCKNLQGHYVNVKDTDMDVSKCMYQNEVLVNNHSLKIIDIIEKSDRIIVQLENCAYKHNKNYLTKTKIENDYHAREIVAGADESFYNNFCDLDIKDLINMYEGTYVYDIKLTKYLIRLVKKLIS